MAVLAALDHVDPALAVCMGAAGQDISHSHVLVNLGWHRPASMEIPWESRCLYKQEAAPRLDPSAVIPILLSQAFVT